MKPGEIVTGRYLLLSMNLSVLQAFSHAMAISYRPLFKTLLREHFYAFHQNLPTLEDAYKTRIFRDNLDPVRVRESHESTMGSRSGIL
jgi:hypothetical protein